MRVQSAHACGRKLNRCACLLTLLWGCGRRARSLLPAWPCSWGRQRQMRYVAAPKTPAENWYLLCATLLCLVCCWSKQMLVDLTAPASLRAGFLHRRVQQPWRIQHPHRLCGAGGAQLVLMSTVPTRQTTYSPPLYCVAEQLRLYLSCSLTYERYTFCSIAQLAFAL